MVCGDVEVKSHGKKSLNQIGRRLRTGSTEQWVGESSRQM